MTWVDRLVERDDVRLNTRTEPVVAGPEAPHAVVIGAGFGGLAAAVRLGARGFRVTVVDRLEQPGGRARVFRQDGFTFDAGPTVITAPFLFEELWSLCGKRFEDDIDLRPVSPFYRIRFDDGTSFDYTGDAEAMKHEIARFAPGDAEGYERFLAKSREIFRVGFEELAHVPFSRVQESEADQYGLRLMASAGFDPRESVNLWINMGKTEKGQPPEFLSTHPSHSTRINDLK